ncbi:hypothetical protein Ocin01_05690 [Orchesella cincta]|uniref:Uncharacterized protein n=1 Tax=Orchesella cincta TaxID=48709 RepID=A0A1D2N6X6_ORCCI|nr:hypothetical protein Ocin01_05690 [Orchesella cincta]
MAERRIARRSQSMKQKFNNDDITTIPEESKRETDEEKAVVAKSKDATVEVTVKVKKRRDKSTGLPKRFVPLQEKEFRKGSWGDLLLAGSRVSLAGKEGILDKKITEESRAHKHSSERKGDKKKNEGGHSPLCQKIPISDDLYLETHTHFKPRSTDEPKSSVKATTSRQKELIRENEELRDEIEHLQREVEQTRIRSRHVKPYHKATPVSSRDWQYEFKSRKYKSKPQTQATQTSTSCLVSPKKKTTATYTTTDGGPLSPPKKLVVSQPVAEPVPIPQVPQLDNLRLEKENEALRLEAAQLVAEMNKARAEYLECCSTMRELYHIAENLKRDNQNLLQNHEQQQTLQSKLLQALAENREMKEVLDSIVDKQKSSHGFQDDQLSQIRNVIKDVKMTIAQEMQGLAYHPSASAYLAEKDDSDSAFKVGESFLNDTNASEIQRILETEPPEMRRGAAQDDRSSSTQYLTVGGLSGFDGSHYRPSPLADNQFSPKISTPNSSTMSLNITEEGATSFRPIQKTAIRKEVKHRDDNEWKQLEEEVVRSFIPVRNELSTCSTSSYSCSSSSSPNPMGK